VSNPEIESNHVVVAVVVELVVQAYHTASIAGRELHRATVAHSSSTKSNLNDNFRFSKNIFFDLGVAGCRE
jgi:hypothetical protein